MAPRTGWSALPNPVEWPAPDGMQLSAVILAGGQSRRMGQDKAWVEFRGKPLIQLAYERICGLGVAEVFISGRYGQDYPLPSCRVLVDLEPDIGPLAGIERALRESTSPLVLVLPVDLPGMSLELLRKLTLYCDVFTGAVARLRGELEPLVAIYPKRCHPLAVLNLANGRYSVRDFASACLQERAIRTFRVPARDERCFLNCNRPADLVSASGGLV